MDKVESLSQPPQSNSCLGQCHQKRAPVRSATSSRIGPARTLSRIFVKSSGISRGNSPCGSRVSTQSPSLETVPSAVGRGIAEDMGWKSSVGPKGTCRSLRSRARLHQIVNCSMAVVDRGNLDHFCCFPPLLTADLVYAAGSVTEPRPAPG